jgi:uncharacterized protein YoxC
MLKIHDATLIRLLSEILIDIVFFVLFLFRMDKIKTTKEIEKVTKEIEEVKSEIGKLKTEIEDVKTKINNYDIHSSNSRDISRDILKLKIY